MKNATSVLVAIEDLEEFKKLVSRVEADINQLDDDLKLMNNYKLRIKTQLDDESNQS